MNVFKKLFLFICAIFILVGCLDSTGPEPTPIIEPSGISSLYIDNQTSLNLNVTYKMTDNYSGLDSTVAVPAESVTQILRAGGFSPPFPSNVLANLFFYNSSGETESPIFMIDPVVDEGWNSTGIEVIEVDDGSYLSAAKFELVITDEEL